MLVLYFCVLQSTADMWVMRSFCGKPSNCTYLCSIRRVLQWCCAFAKFDGTPDVKCEGLNSPGWFKESAVHGNRKMAQLKYQVSIISSWTSRCLSNVKAVRFMWRRSCLILTCLHPYWFTSACSHVALSFSRSAVLKNVISRGGVLRSQHSLSSVWNTSSSAPSTVHAVNVNAKNYGLVQIYLFFHSTTSLLEWSQNNGRLCSETWHDQARGNLHNKSSPF